MDELKCPHCGKVIDQVELDWSALHSKGFLKNECETCAEEYELSLNCELEVN